MINPSDKRHRPAPAPAQPARIRPRDVWTVWWVTILVIAGLWLLRQTQRIIVWVLVAAFFATVLTPLVKRLSRKMRRSAAVAVVTMGFLLLVGTGGYVFGRPLVQQTVGFVTNLPQTIQQAQRVPVIKDLSKRFDLQARVRSISTDLPKRAFSLSGPLLSAFKTAGSLAIALLTVFVFTIFLLIYGPSFVESGLALIGDSEKRTSARETAEEVGRMFTGWLAGNVLTSTLATIASLIAFLIAGLPYAVLLSLWVGITDLLPLIGATMGAIPAVVIGFIHSVPSGIAMVIYFLIYQQFENHVLQPAVYGRTIRINPFVVLVSVLVGVELAGFLGALFAIPVAGAIQILAVEAVGIRRRRRFLGPDAPLLETGSSADAS